MKKLKPVHAEHALTPAQLACLASDPLRRIVEVLTEDKALSRREIAERLGRPATSVHYQLKRLIVSGLVIENGHRPSERRPEILFQLISNRLSSSAASTSPEGRRAIAIAGRKIVSAAGRSFFRAVESDQATLSGPQRSAAVRRLVLNLTPGGLARLNEVLEALTNEQVVDLETGDQQVSLTIVLS